MPASTREVVFYLKPIIHESAKQTLRDFAAAHKKAQEELEVRATRGPRSTSAYGLPEAQEVERRVKLNERAVERQLQAAERARVRENAAQEAVTKRFDREFDKRVLAYERAQEREAKAAGRTEDMRWREVARQDARQFAARMRTIADREKTEATAKKEQERTERQQEMAVRQQERAHLRMQVANLRVSHGLEGIALSALRATRGLALMGVAGQESTQRLLQGLVKVEAGFDVLSGGLAMIHQFERLGISVQRARMFAAAAGGGARAGGLAGTLGVGAVEGAAMAGGARAVPWATGIAGGLFGGVKAGLGAAFSGTGAIILGGSLLATEAIDRLRGGTGITGAIGETFEARRTAARIRGAEEIRARGYAAQQRQADETAPIYDFLREQRARRSEQLFRETEAAARAPYLTRFAAAPPSQGYQRLALLEAEKAASASSRKLAEANIPKAEQDYAEIEKVRKQAAENLRRVRDERRAIEQERAVMIDGRLTPVSEIRGKVVGGGMAEIRSQTAQRLEELKRAETFYGTGQMSLQEVAKRQEEYANALARLKDETLRDLETTKQLAQAKIDYRRAALEQARTIQEQFFGHARRAEEQAKGVKERIGQMNPADWFRAQMAVSQLNRGGMLTPQMEHDIEAVGGPDLLNKLRQRRVGLGEKRLSEAGAEIRDILAPYEAKQKLYEKAGGEMQARETQLKLGLDKEEKEIFRAMAEAERTTNLLLSEIGQKLEALKAATLSRQMERLLQNQPKGNEPAGAPPDHAKQVGFASQWSAAGIS